ncbi:hypothetical protein WISP_04827 [Willisornis vidua]|uniref:Uncharacterized protein n=1 Tax=Willisornis vidua TaxID=1566151 RepID=A0ABQ9DXS5_9PASS|nr:hypothetical protein WISP_04827 [Willisornis vidua]
MWDKKLLVAEEAKATPWWDAFHPKSCILGSEVGIEYPLFQSSKEIVDGQVIVPREFGRTKIMEQILYS